MLERLESFLRALWFSLTHPSHVLSLTVSRRYADAQGNYVGELYERGRMIGASYDNWPLNADTMPIPIHPQVCWAKTFLEPLPKNTLRVGAWVPQDNNDVQAYFAMRRFCPFKIIVLNRFVEHVMEKNI
jgi:hypothetical protein